MQNYNLPEPIIAPEDINIRITGQAAIDLHRLAQQLEIAPEEVVADALRLLRTTVDNRLYVRKGRLTSQAPALHALGFWREVVDLGATGTIEVNTRRGPVAFRLPREAFRASPTAVTYGPPLWGSQVT